MSAPFKVQAQAKANGETLKSKKGHGSKKKPRKAATANKKAKGEPQPQQEVIVHEPEAAGEDDHAFFDDEENADYAKFMLSLDSSELTTFSKRAKDGVAVAPTSKKKSKQSKQNLAALPPSQAEGEAAPATAALSDGTPAAVVDSGSPTTETAPPAESPVPLVTKAPRSKEAVVDAKRRKASTTGWVVEESGPQRLPIKTRRGVLKTNERMQQQRQDDASPSTDTQSTQDGHKHGSGVAENGVDQPTTGEAMETEEPGLPPGHGAGGDVSDAMSDGDGSVYDSAADSGLDDYAMGEPGHNGGRPTTADGGGGSSGGGRGGGGIALGKVDLAVLRQRRFGQKKALIAVLCESILGAPEESLTRPKTVAKGEDERSRMEQLFAMVSGCLPVATAVAAASRSCSCVAGSCPDIPTRIQGQFEGLQNMGCSPRLAATRTCRQAVVSTYTVPATLISWQPHSACVPHASRQHRNSYRMSTAKQQ